MNQALEARLTLFAENAQCMKKDFVWHDDMIKRLSALLYALEDKRIAGGLVRECHELIKRSTGMLSSFRGNLAICFATLLSLAENREAQLSGTLAVYGMMKEARFLSSDYLAMAAYQIAANTTHDQYARAVERMRAFYDAMKENHRFYTGSDDYIFAAMLALSDIDPYTGADCMERLFNRLKPEFSFGNSIHTLAQVLVLGGETEDVLYRLTALRDAMKDRKLRLDGQYTLSSLGVLALMTADAGAAADDVQAAYEFLREKKGFGRLSVMKQELLLLSAAAVASIYADDMKSGVVTASLSTTITTILIAQQVVIVAMAASSAASSSSSST